MFASDVSLLKASFDALASLNSSALSSKLRGSGNGCDTGHPQGPRTQGLVHEERHYIGAIGM